MTSELHDTIEHKIWDSQEYNDLMAKLPNEDQRLLLTVIHKAIDYGITRMANTAKEAFKCK